MLHVLTAALAFQVSSSFIGVYATADGATFGLLTENCAMGMIKERHYTYQELKQVPDGSMLGWWWSDDKMTAGSGGNPTSWNVGVSKSVQKGQYEGFSGSYLPKIGSPKKASEMGEIRLNYGRPDASGVVRYFDTSIYDSQKTVRASGQLRFICGWQGVTFDGAYLDGPISIVFKDAPGIYSNFSGSLTYGTSKYLIAGGRVGFRGSFYVTEASTGRLNGSGYVEWIPTASRLMRIMNREASGTDRLVVSYKVPETPAGAKRFLTRS